jgi:hypothetical protein
MDDEATFSARAHRARGREHDQREGLATLGLSEVEAVEYVLMLSRDEANRGRATSGAADITHDIDEGVFEGDFDGHGRFDHGGTPRVSSIVSSNSSGSGGSVSSGRSSATTSPITRGLGLSRAIPGAAGVMEMSKFSPSSHSSSSSTNQKVQISPRQRAEPLEAGEERRVGDGRGEEGRGTRLGLDEHYFPPVGSTGKNVDERFAEDNATDTVNSRQGTPSPKSNKKRSPVPSRSAWSTPLTKKLSLSPPNMTADRVPDTSQSAGSSGPAVASGSVTISPTTSPFIDGRAGVGFNAGLIFRDQTASEVDEDLRFALELSLAEAESTKGVV